MHERRERDLNPRGVSPNSLAGCRPTRLGDPGIKFSVEEELIFFGFILIKGVTHIGV